MSEDERALILNKIKAELGEAGVQIVAILYDTEKLLTVEEIEEKLTSDNDEMDAKGIRQVLYQLSDYGYARSRRYRDDETGWISFLWNLFPEKILK